MERRKILHVLLLGLLAGIRDMPVEDVAPSITATIGIRVSGRAVPTAAKMLPSRPSLRLSFFPSHSILLVKTSQPIKMRTSPKTSISQENHTMQSPRKVCVYHN